MSALTRDLSAFSFDDDGGLDGGLDLQALVADGSLIEDDTLGDDPFAELSALSRRISGQYVEVIAAWARAAFRDEDDPAWRHRTAASLGPLVRLAEASHDAELRDVAVELIALADPAGTVPRTLLLPRLRDAVAALALLLDGDDAARLRALVEVDRAAFPLADRLVEVHGIGPRRLERLYCAGLVTVESLVDAAPEEVAQVAGLPRGLADAVVEAARDFERRRRAQLAEDLRRRSEEVRAVVRWLDASGRRDDEVVSAVRDAIESLQQVLDPTPAP